MAPGRGLSIRLLHAWTLRGHLEAGAGFRMIMAEPVAEDLILAPRRNPGALWSNHLSSC